MPDVRASQRGFRQRVTSCIAAYALALHGVFFAFASTQLTAIAGADQNLFAHELCMHSAEDGAASFPGGDPLGHTEDGRYHCVLCVVGSQPFGAIPVPNPAPIPVANRGAALWPDRGWQLSGSRTSLSPPPRGPPLIA